MRKRLHNGPKSRRVDGSHCLHGNNALLGSRVEHALGLASIGGEGLLDKHVLASAHQGKRLGGVHGIGGADVDSIDVGAGTKLVEGIEGKRASVLARKGTGASEVSRVGPRIRGTLVAGQRIEKALGYPARTDGCDPYLLPFGHGVPLSTRQRHGTSALGRYQGATQLLREILKQGRPGVAKRVVWHGAHAPKARAHRLYDRP